ncbi:hypothetical protein [Aromatoleum buckelii]|uniref:Uncharacterized protein n=1 Tax=Aromatoleum buckelii TaxID=200254 RepID=A0ABX1N2C1_9RHOO|nr:hypothetical protein [Aromatoleum buckelii]MCK0512953.1 hypothetical protein [Aromatoleum buckelii]
MANLCREFQLLVAVIFIWISYPAEAVRTVELVSDEELALVTGGAAWIDASPSVLGPLSGSPGDVSVSFALLEPEQAKPVVMRRSAVDVWPRDDPDVVDVPEILDDSQLASGPYRSRRVEGWVAEAVAALAVGALVARRRLGRH